MVAILKAAAVCGACVGFFGFTWWVSTATGEILCRDLSTDKDFSIEQNGIYHNKYASDYAKYFVGVSDESKGEPKIDNTPWWELIFKERYQKADTNSKKRDFQNKNNANDLKEACKSAYKADKGKVKENASQEGEFEESNVWDFCSIGGNKPKSISEVSSETSTYGEETNYGGKSDYNKLLISVTDQNNNWFWDIKERELLESTTYPSDLNDSNSKFKQLHTSDNQNKDFTKRKVKELCKQAYSSAFASSTDFPKKAVFKFCSLKGQEPTGGS